MINIDYFILLCGIIAFIIFLVLVSQSVEWPEITAESAGAAKPHSRHIPAIIPIQREPRPMARPPFPSGIEEPRKRETRDSKKDSRLKALGRYDMYKSQILKKEPSRMQRIESVEMSELEEESKIVSEESTIKSEESSLGAQFSSIASSEPGVAKSASAYRDKSTIQPMKSDATKVTISEQPSKKSVLERTTMQEKSRKLLEGEVHSISGSSSDSSYDRGSRSTYGDRADSTMLNTKEERRGALIGLAGDLDPSYKLYPKTKAQYEEIKNALLKNDLIKKMITPELVAEVINAMWWKNVDTLEVIIQQGDFGDLFYVSNNGRYKVIIDEETYDSFSDQRVFGELAVLYNCPRAARIIATTPGGIWVLSREILRAILVKFAKQDVELRLNFLQRVPHINEGSIDKLRQIAKLLKKVYFEPEEIIVKEGEEGSQFYIIAAGTVTVTKEGIGVVASLKEGDFFGEKALLEMDVRKATVTADVPDGVECFVLNQSDFAKYLGDLTTFIREAQPADKQPVEKQVIQQEFAGLSLNELKHEKILGIGGFGRVELVEYAPKQNVFALKCVSKYDNQSTELREHIFNEKNIQMACNSPFIVHLHRTFQDRKFLYYLMEICLGGDIFSLMQKQHGRYFTEVDAKFIVACVTEGLSYLHENDFVYRDLKPENMLIDSLGYVKLADFGFAKQIGKTDQTFTFVGTPEYVAPEVIYNRGHYRAVDYWALGVLVFELLVGRTPFKTGDPTFMKTYSLILKGIENTEFPKRVSRNATSIIKKLCRLTPHERLGCQKGGADDIREHKWFINFDWELLVTRKIPSSLVPQLKSYKDTRYFDDFGEDRRVIIEDPNDELWRGF